MFTSTKAFLQKVFKKDSTSELERCGASSINSDCSDVLSSEEGGEEYVGIDGSCQVISVPSSAFTQAPVLSSEDDAPIVHAKPHFFPRSSAVQIEFIQIKYNHSQ